MFWLVAHRRLIRLTLVPFVLFTLFALLTAADGAAAAEPPVPADSITAPADYVLRAAPAAAVPDATLAPATVLLLKDADPWDSTANEQILSANSISYVVMGSAGFPAADLRQYQTIIVASDQPQGFYDVLAANEAKLASFVRDGGTLQFGAAAWGWNGGDASAVTLPGGTAIHEEIWVYNSLWMLDHPVVADVPNPFRSMWASHAVFDALLPYTDIIVTAGDVAGGAPTLIEYRYGAGCVLALGQTLEYGYEFGEPTGIILRNAILYSVNSACRNVAVPKQIFGWLYIDENRNGWRDVGEDEGVPEAPVLLSDANKALLMPSYTTIPRGWYQFDDFPAGDYCIRMVLPPHYVPTTPMETCFTYDGSQLNVNFGVVREEAFIGDTVYADANGNGVQDAGETGYADVTLALWSAVDGQPGEAVADATTDAEGHYHFTVTPGSYFVQITDTNGVLNGLTLTGAVNPAGPVTVTHGQTYADADFGYNFVCPASRSILSGRVWVDENGDGTLSDADTGVRGVTVCANPLSQMYAPRCTLSAADGVYRMCVRPLTYLVAPTVDADSPIAGLMPIDRAFRLPLAVKPGMQLTDINFGYKRAMPVQ